MVLTSDEAWGFDQTWVSLAFLVWIAICWVISAILLPAERRFAAGDDAAEKTVARAGQTATIWKPGA